MAISTQLICNFNTILINISVKYFSEIDKHSLKFIWNFKGHKLAEPILKNKNKSAESILQFQTCSKATLIKTGDGRESKVQK